MSFESIENLNTSGGSLLENDEDIEIDWEKNKKKREERLREGYYDPKKEYHCSLEDEAARKQIEQSHELYRSFVEEYLAKLDLGDSQSILDAYEEAQKRGIFAMAEVKRNLLFGKDVKFYGVSYLRDLCANNCEYCSAGIDNRKQAIKEGKTYPLKELSVEQAVEDTLAVMDDGHTHICYLEGSPADIDKYPDRIISYLTNIIRETKDRGLEEIILNIEPLTTAGFQKIMDAVEEANAENGTKVSVQFRVFQETYNPDVYSKAHPGDPDAYGRKSNFLARHQSQSRALAAGVDNIGMGALFGLNPRALEELEGLRRHVEEIQRDFGVSPARICLPSANELENIGTKIPYFLERGKYNDMKSREELIEPGVYEKFNELVYALLRLAVEVSIVSSERDGPAMLDILRKYADCETLNVHTSIGSNAEIPMEKTVVSQRSYERYLEAKAKRKEDGVEFEQAATFPRPPRKTIETMESQGYNPIINTGAKNLSE